MAETTSGTINIARLVRRRRALKLSQAEVAKQVKVTQAAISQWETGLVQPIRPHLIRLARVLDVEREYLVRK